VTTSGHPARIVVGLTGPNAAGKGEAARFLVSRGLAYHSLSDIIRAEAERLGLPPTRENLIQLGNDLRRQGGPGALAERTLAKLSGRDVVDSIRNVAEVETLRREPAFVLLVVDAPIEIRFERARARARPGDGTTLEEFAAREQRERSADPAAQQLHLAAKSADLVVDNSGTIPELHARVEQLLRGRI